MSSKSDESWPAWPQGSKGQRVVDVKVACSADELFLLLWGPKSPYVAEGQRVLGDKDCSETAWCSRLEDLEGGKQGSPPKQALKAAAYKGMYRKNTSSGSSMKMKYVNTELQRCLQAGKGGPFEVEVVVQTTATYGERFRPIIKHRIEGSGPDKCSYTVDYALVYIASTNGWLKAAIEKGATNGITKNFQVLVDVLSKFKNVGDGPEQPKPPADDDQWVTSILFLIAFVVGGAISGVFLWVVMWLLGMLNTDWDMPFGDIVIKWIQGNLTLFPFIKRTASTFLALGLACSNGRANNINSPWFALPVAGSVGFMVCSSVGLVSLAVAYAAGLYLYLYVLVLFYSHYHITTTVTITLPKEHGVVPISVNGNSALLLFSILLCLRFVFPQVCAFCWGSPLPVIIGSLPGLVYGYVAGVVTYHWARGWPKED